MPSININVKSAGFNVGNTASFTLDGQPVSMSYARGLNVVVIDPTTRQDVWAQTFDTEASSQAGDDFAALIEELPIGFVVGVAVMDEAASRLTDRARRACELIGSALIYNLQYRGSWGLVGQKGAPLGSALEKLDNTQVVQFTATQPLPTPEQLTYRLRAYSAGHDVGNTFWIQINERQLSFSGDSRGLNVAVIDTQTCQVVSQHNFDTFLSAAAADQFAQLVNGLPLGQFVAVAVKDDAAANLTANAKQAFELLGSGFINQLQYNNSYVLFGQKGAPFGSAAESLSTTMPVMCEAWLSPRPAGWEGFAVSTVCASPQAGEVCSTYVDGVPVGALAKNTSGVLVTVIDEKTGVKLQSANFNPARDATASAALANLLLSIPTGRVVVVNATMGAASHLNSDALYACTLIGSAQIFNAKNDHHACWCIIGRKGCAPGSAPECFGRCMASLQYWFQPDATRRPYADVRVSSAGMDVGNSASIAVNGHELANWGRGMNVAVFDQTTGNVLQTATYDTCASQEVAAQFAALVEGLPAGRIVAVAVQDEASHNLTDRAKLACESIGSARIRQLEYRGSWAIVGVKGAAVGTVDEALGTPQRTSLVGYQLFTSAARQNPGVAVRASSAGFDAGNAASIAVNNQVVAMTYGRGLNVVVIDRATGQVTHKQAFDTCASADASNDFAALVEGLPFGSIVAVAVLDEAHARLNERAKRACRMLGSERIYQLGYRNSWAIVGMKGAGAGSAVEALGTNGAVSVETWVPVVPLAQTRGLFFLIGFFLVFALIVARSAAELNLLPEKSDPRTPTYIPPPPTQPPPTSRARARKALLVAINYTGMSTALGRDPTNGLDFMKRQLINGSYIAAADITVLTDLNDKKDVSITNVKNALRQLVKGAEAGDVLYFYFFGHGMSLQTSSESRRESSRRECLVLMKDDGTGTDNFYDVDLAAIIDTLPPKTNLTMTFNSCHSGGMADYIPYAPKRGITLAAVPYDREGFFSGGFSQFLCRRLGKYARAELSPLYKPLMDEVIHDMKTLGGFADDRLPQLMCDSMLYNVNTLGFLRPIPF
jgi:hypothetical protein